MPVAHVALATELQAVHGVARQALTAPSAYLDPLAGVLAAALVAGFVGRLAHRRALFSTRRPSSVIRTVATSNVREPATTRSAVAVASPARTSSTICSVVNPCARMSPSVQPSGRSRQFERADGVGFKGALAARRRHWWFWIPRKPIHPAYWLLHFHKNKRKLHIVRDR
jgi:hypothetical protein